MKKVPAETVLEFCPVLQAWWPRGEAPEGASLTAAAKLAHDTMYEPGIGIRSRDVRLVPLNDDIDTDVILDE